MIKFLTLIACVLLSIAFMTLFERKILSFAQLRKGPNVVGSMGVLQPFSDGVKLLTKEDPAPLVGSKAMLLPLTFFIIMLTLWLPLYEGVGVSVGTNILLLLFISSLGGLLTFFIGWGGGSSYSFMGGVRASAQVISYEVVFFFILIAPLSYLGSFDMGGAIFLLSPHPPTFPLFFFLSLLPLWFTTLLAETNRAPFDLTEGESELVSGFNTEYSSLFFVFLFLGEYGFLLFFSYLSSFLIFLDPNYTILVVFFLLWVRANFPRKRYDLLMVELWTISFPLACSFLLFCLLIFI